jgi:hypothetical protein
LDVPGRDRSLFSPTFLDPSLILLELALNGSGAATFESFYGYDKWCILLQGKQQGKNTDSHLLQTMMMIWVEALVDDIFSKQSFSENPLTWFAPALSIPGNCLPDIRLLLLKLLSRTQRNNFLITDFTEFSLQIQNFIR